MRLLRELYFNSSGLLFLLTVLFALAMLFVSQQVHGTAGQFWLAVGTSLIATTGYSFLQVLLTTRQFDRFLSETIQTTVREAIATSATQIARQDEDQRRRFSPISRYAEVKEPDPAFNRDLNESLESSGHYIFCGMTARYAVARLACLRKVPGDVKLIIADPTKPAAVDYRARRRVEPGDEAAFEKERRHILDGIYMSIVGAYLGRRRHDHLQMCLTAVPYVNRVEICDSEIYVSFFSEAQHSKLEFPPVMRFARESLIYGMYLQDCSRLLASPYLTRFTLMADMSEADFLDQLRAVGVAMTTAQWEGMKKRFPEFRESQRNLLIPP